VDCTNTYSMCSRSTSQNVPFWLERTEFREGNLNFRVPDLECIKVLSYIAENKPLLHMGISCNTYIIFLTWHFSCKLLIMVKVMYNVKVTWGKPDSFLGSGKDSALFSVPNFHAVRIKYSKTPKKSDICLLDQLEGDNVKTCNFSLVVFSAFTFLASPYSHPMMQLFSLTLQ